MPFLLFSLSFVILAFEVVSAPVLSFVLGSGYVLMAVSIAFLAQGAGTILLYALRRRLEGKISAAEIAGWACLLGLAVAGAFYGISSVQRILNEVVNRAAPGNIQGDWTAARQKFAPLFGLILGLPHFVFAVGLNLIYLRTPEERFRRSYLCELGGGALGCIAGVALLEWGGYSEALLVLLWLAFSAAAFCLLRSGGSRRMIRTGVWSGGLTAALITFGILARPELFDPPASADLLARNWNKSFEVSEVFHRWNSNTRFALLKIQDQFPWPSYLLSLGSGEGHATVPFYRRDPTSLVDKPILAKLLTALKIPRELLVLCAGVGGDIARVSTITGNLTKMTGVEINRQMVEEMLSRDEFKLGKMLERAGAKLVISDARIFLATNTRRYSEILVSYHGTSSVQFLSSFGVTTQYLYTQEALNLMLKRLKPGGMLIFVSGNKFNLLQGLMGNARRHGGIDPSRAAIVLTDPKAVNSAWYLAADSNVLLIRPDGFAPADVAKIAASAQEGRLEIAYAPGMPINESFRPYANLLNAQFPAAYVSEISKILNKRLGMAADDRPFPMNQLEFRDYLSSEMLVSVLQKLGMRSFDFTLEEYEFLSLWTVAGLSFALVMCALVTKSGVKYVRSGSYFFAVGLAFIFLEVAFYHKMILLVGNPTLALAVSIAGLLVFAGLGALSSEWTFRRLHYGYLVLVLCLGLSLFLLGHFQEDLQNLAWSLPLNWRIFFIGSVIAPVAFLQGHFFPRGMTIFNYGSAVLLWGRAANILGNTLGVALSAILAKTLGINALAACGLACYIFAAVISPRARKM